MTSWMNEAAAVQNHNGNNAFAHMNDPNNLAGGPANMMDPAAFMGNPAQFNAAAAAGQFANPQQMAAAMQNGQMRNASPSFQNPVYQTNPIIPSKRPRPREDSIGASPRQNPGMLPTSRADTPQQSPFPGGFQPNGMPQAQPPQQHGVGQPQYPHLQPNGSATASPSPVMAGNQLRPGSVPQRVNTASPHPFSPASQQFGPQASPVPSEHGGTPQPNPYMQNQNFPPGFNPNYVASPSPARPPSGQNPMAPQMMPQQMQQQMAQMGQMGQMGQMQQMQQMQQMHPGQMHPNQMAQMAQMQQQMQQQMAAGRGGMDPAQQQKMLYQMRLQQMQQGNMQMAAQMQHQPQNIGQGRGMMPNKQPMPMSMANGGQMPPGGMNPQQAQMARATNPETFMKNLTQFMNLQGLPLDPNPIIEGRPLHLMQLFMVVGKFGSYRSVMARNLWGQVAGAVGFQPAQIPSAPAIIKAIYEKNLLRFEEAWRNKKGGAQPMGTPSPMPMGPGPGTPQRMGSQGQMPPGHSPMQPGMQPGQPQPMPPAQQTPMKTPAMPQPNINGFSTPQQNHMPQQPPSVPPSHMRNSLSRNVETPPVGDFPAQSPSMGKPGSMSMPAPHIPTEPIQSHGQTMTLPFPGHSASDPDEYVACSRELKDDGYGGIEPNNFCTLADQLEQWRPDVPPPMELGNIDVQALTKSLQCGIHGEVRLALDTLGSITHQAQSLPPLVLDLRFCDDLVESLVDCAEEQVDELAEATKPVCDEIDLPSYEEVLRIRRYERFNLKKFAVFGEAESELEHAADRLIAIMTILRNLSFIDGNTPILADEAVVKFLCSAIRSLGTLENFLRSPSNTLDFMKDAIVFLSNIAGSVELPGRDHALCLLQFLLSFAPSPAPDVASGKVLFAPFDPSLHPYLPLAVDALAKLLARDEPNRTHYKAIFAADAASAPACELLTRAFGLAICSVPDQTREGRHASLPSLVEARKPTLMQGLLAADILASLAPGHESGITRMWLSSSEGFAQNLFRLIRTLCSQAEPPPPPTTGRGANSRTQPREDQDVLHIINWGVSALKRLGEKARDPHNPSSIPPNALPTKESLFGALHSLKSPKWTVLLNQLSAYAGLED